MNQEVSAFDRRKKCFQGKHTENSSKVNPENNLSG
jgi:hypothetical protein